MGNHSAVQRGWRDGAAGQAGREAESEVGREPGRLGGWEIMERGGLGGWLGGTRILGVVGAVEGGLVWGMGKARGAGINIANSR